MTANLLNVPDNLNGRVCSLPVIMNEGSLESYKTSGVMMLSVDNIYLIIFQTISLFSPTDIK